MLNIRTQRILLLCLLIAYSFAVGNAYGATAVIVTPRTFVSQEQLQYLTYVLRTDLQAKGINLVPDVAVQLGSLEARNYLTPKSSADEIHRVLSAMGADSLILVEVTRWDTDAMAWSLVECVLIIPWLWHPFGFYDYTEMGITVCVYNSGGHRVFAAPFSERTTGMWGLNFWTILAGGRATSGLIEERCANTIHRLAADFANAVCVHLQR